NDSPLVPVPHADHGAPMVVLKRPALKRALTLPTMHYQCRIFAKRFHRNLSTSSPSQLVSRVPDDSENAFPIQQLTVWRNIDVLLLHHALNSDGISLQPSMVPRVV